MPPPSVSRYATRQTLMHNVKTNLLPRERRSALRRGYFIRLGVVGALLITALTLVSAVLLVPTYLFLKRSADTKQTRLVNIETALSASDEPSLAAHLTALSDNIATLATLANIPSASAVIRKALTIPHPDVTLSGFVYTPASTSGSNGMLAITGTAATRNALRTYQLALRASPLVLSVDLPVSAYAMDTNSAFTATLTLAP